MRWPRWLRPWPEPDRPQHGRRWPARRRRALGPGLWWAPSSAGRAAKLSSAPADEDEEEDPRGRWPRVKPWLLPVAALLVVVAGLWGAYAWTQTQYYVSSDTQHVVIYKGVPQTLGPISLHSVAEVSDLSVSALKPFEKARIDSGLRTDSLTAARTIVDSLRTGT